MNQPPENGRRMSREERRDMIIDGAVRFFSEHGFGANTRDLAKELGVSHGLLFRYFEKKGDLLDEVYRRNFLRRWSDAWIDDLQERSTPLRDRLIAFYEDYIRVIDERHWVRLILLAGLSDTGLTSRYINENVSPLLCTIANEALAASDQGSPIYASADDMTQKHLEWVWHLHSSIIYYLIRKHIFGVTVTDSPREMIEIAVDGFIAENGR